MKHINVQNLQCTKKGFFKIWLIVLQPFLKLRDQEMDVLASLLYYRFKISKEITNENIANDILFGTTTRKSIKADLKIPGSSFNNILTALRKKGLIIDNKIIDKIVPVIESDLKNFKFVYNIDINEDIQK